LKAWKRNGGMEKEWEMKGNGKGWKGGVMHLKIQAGILTASRRSTKHKPFQVFITL